MAGSEAHHTSPGGRNGIESSRVQANPPNPVSCHVAGGTAGKEGGGLVPLGGGYINQGHIGNDHPSLAKEATTWLEARNPSTRGPERAGPAPLTETRGPAPTAVGIAIEERDLTPEDFWSLLSDAGYEVW